MSHAMRPRMTPEEFLAWEEGQELRWEFDGFQPVAMTGGTVAHSLIQANLITALTTRLRGRECRAHGPSVKVQIGPRYRYPDAMVVCTQLSRGATSTADPVVLFEVLSKGTAFIDRTAKLLEYRSLASARRYVLVEQDQAIATVYSRTPSGWIVDQLLADGILAMPEIGIEVPISELYADVDLPDASDVLLEDG